MALSLMETTKKAKKDHNISNDIMDFLYLITDNTLNDKNDKDVKNELIRALFKEGFEINDPSGTKKIGSKVIQQCLWRVMSKVKMLDTSLNGTGKGEDVEKLVSEGVNTVADRGGLTVCMSDKGGVFMNSFLYGDGFLFFGKGENDENPVSFRVLRNEDVYFDSAAKSIRGNHPATKMVIIYQFHKDEAYYLYPELEENDVYGKIPGTYRSEDSEEREDEDIVEIAWAWNKAKRMFVQFAGTSCYEIDKFEEEEYPYIKNKKAFIPVFQFMCQPSADGLLNYGVGEMAYDLAVITRKLLNLEVTHIEENVLPMTYVNAPQNKVDELIEKMAMANEARKQGKKPIVAMEYDQAGKQGVTSNALVTQNLINEWQIVWDRLYKELSRLGINLDDIERGSGITRGQVIAEEEASNAFIKQMMDYNATETKELLECTMDAITEFVSNKNKTPLNLMTRITLKDGSTSRLDKDITMGMLSKELKDGNWFITPDRRSGSAISDLTKLIYEERQIQMTPPGTPEYNELYRRIAMRRGIDIQLQQPQQQGGAQGGQAQGGEEQAQPVSGTQRQLPEMTGNIMQPV